MTYSFVMLPIGVHPCVWHPVPDRMVAKHDYGIQVDTVLSCQSVVKSLADPGKIPLMKLRGAPNYDTVSINQGESTNSIFSTVVPLVKKVIIIAIFWVWWS